MGLKNSPLAKVENQIVDCKQCVRAEGFPGNRLRSIQLTTPADRYFQSFDFQLLQWKVLCVSRRVEVHCHHVSPDQQLIYQRWNQLLAALRKAQVSEWIDWELPSLSSTNAKDWNRLRVELVIEVALTGVRCPTMFAVDPRAAVFWDCSGPFQNVSFLEFVESLEFLGHLKLALV